MGSVKEKDTVIEVVKSLSNKAFKEKVEDAVELLEADGYVVTIDYRPLRESEKQIMHTALLTGRKNQ